MSLVPAGPGDFCPACCASCLRLVSLYWLVDPLCPEEEKKCLCDAGFGLLTSINEWSCCFFSPAWPDRSWCECGDRIDDYGTGEDAHCHGMTMLMLSSQGGPILEQLSCCTTQFQDSGEIAGQAIGIWCRGEKRSTSKNKHGVTPTYTVHPS